MVRVTVPTRARAAVLSSSVFSTKTALSPTRREAGVAREQYVYVRKFIPAVTQVRLGQYTQSPQEMQYHTA